MTFQEHFINRLKALPEKRVHEFPADAIPARHHKSAIMLPFWPAPAGGVEVVMTKRTETVSSHPGQVSFPGGRMEETDASPQAAALREAREELGIDPGLVQIMGRLDDAWSRAGHHVFAYVAWLAQKPHFDPNPDEVAEVIIADVETLMRPQASREHEVVINNETYRTHAFSWDGGYVWGITADYLLELLLWVKGESANRGELRLEKMKRFSKVKQ